MDLKPVKIKNNVSHTVVINCPDLRFNAVWDKKGAIRMVPFDILQQAIYEPGVESLFKDGFLVIDDMEVKKALYLEPEDATEPVNIIILTDQQKDNLLKNKLYVDFKKTVDGMNYTQAFELANYAIEKDILIAYDKNKYFIGRVNVNVNNSIENIHKAQED